MLWKRTVWAVVNHRRCVDDTGGKGETRKSRLARGERAKVEHGEDGSRSSGARAAPSSGNGEDGNSVDDRGQGPAARGKAWHLWDSGEVGGVECYVEAEGLEEETVDAAVDEGGVEAREAGEGADEEAGSGSDSEDESSGGTLQSVQGRHNCLSLVLRDQGVMHFVKYVSAAAPGSRWDVAAEFQI